MTTEDVRNELIEKYKNGEFRLLYNGTVKTIEIQNAHFTCDKDWIIRKPNYEYAQREIEWYKSQSLYVEDIPGKTPKIWEDCADTNGMINSNYGWCIWSNENGNQYKNCLRTLIKDPYSRQACMLYTRPSMQTDANKDGKHDFMCTYAVQCFLNDKIIDGIQGYSIKYIVYMRSNDAVFGFDNDVLWHKYVQDKLAKDLSYNTAKPVYCEPIEWNAGSLHVYERHFKFLEEPIEDNTPDYTYTEKIADWFLERGLIEAHYWYIVNNENIDLNWIIAHDLTPKQVKAMQTGEFQREINK